MDYEFRGKRLDNGEWEYGDKLSVGSKTYIVNNYDVPVGYYYFDKPNGERINLCAQTLSCLIEVDPATVGMFTGLKDKSKNRAWQGDIVQWQGRVYGVIKYHDYSGGWHIVNPVTGNHIAGCNQSVMDQLEVIGNVTDNPEMLEKK